MRGLLFDVTAVAGAASTANARQPTKRISAAGISGRLENEMHRTVIGAPFDSSNKSHLLLSD
jgi:hypothetical protein